MTSTTISVAGVVLCLISCLGLVIKRQVSPYCQDRPDSCVHNANILVNLFTNRNHGSGSLFVGDRFALKCDAQDIEGTDRCIEENQDCLIGYKMDRIKIGVDFMCSNEEEFINRSSCWNSGSVASVMEQCDSRHNLCSMPGCMRENIANTSECGDQEASLVANMIELALKETLAEC